MKTSVSFSDFCDRFRDMNRNDNFSYEGKRALYDWLEDYEESTGEEQELDIIALCCDFNEYESLDEFHKDYDKANYPDRDAINDHTMLIPINDEAFIIQAF